MSKTLSYWTDRQDYGSYGLDPIVLPTPRAHKARAKAPAPHLKRSRCLLIEHTLYFSELGSNFQINHCGSQPFCSSIFTNCKISFDSFLAEDFIVVMLILSDGILINLSQGLHNLIPGAIYIYIYVGTTYTFISHTYISSKHTVKC